MKNNKNVLSISVVIFKPKFDDLHALFASVKIAGKVADVVPYIYIVDNNPDSNDKDQVDSLIECYDLHDNYEYIKTAYNGGYGYGHNIAINKTIAKYHIICNPDIVLKHDTFKVGLEYMAAHDNIGLLTPSVFGKNGEIHYLCKRNPKLFHLFLRRFVPNSIKNIFFKEYLNLYEYRDKDYTKVIENIPFCTGCFMFFKTDILKNLKGFDERFFMYMEDADLSRRSLQVAKNVYLPTLKVVHAWERGSYHSKKLRNAAIKSAFQYSLKWGFFKKRLTGIFKR